MKVTRTPIHLGCGCERPLRRPGPALAQAPHKLTVRVDFLPWGMHAGLHLAVEKGWFQDAGLEVDVSDGKGSALVMQQVAAGEVESAGCSSARWRRHAARACRSPRSRASPARAISAVWCRRRRTIRTVKDLEGKKVVYTAATSWGSLVDAFLQAGGTSRDKVELVSVDSTALLSVYLSEGAPMPPSRLIRSPSPRADRQRPSNGLLLSDVGINIPSYG